jgi:RimJ/RimL family protein N-acetyltransferase
MSDAVVPPEELSDGVVTLRAWRMTDLPALVEACNDETLHRWLPMIPYPYPEEVGREFISRQPERNAEGAGSLGVFDSETGELLGSIGFRSEHFGRVELGYWTHREHRGRGITPRALRLISRWAVDELGAQRLQLHAEVENIASQRVAEKAGFTREGVRRSYIESAGERRDAVGFSLLPDEL